MRRIAEPALQRASSLLLRRGVMPATTAVAAGVAGLAASACVVLRLGWAAVPPLLLWRLGLSLARTPRDEGADAVARFADLLGRAALPVAFVLQDPANRPTAAALLGALILREVAARRTRGAAAVGAGLGEGAGFTLFALAMVLFPKAFPVLAVALAGITAMSALSRLAFARAFERAEEAADEERDTRRNEP